MARTRIELDSWDDDIDFEREGMRYSASSAPLPKRKRGTRSPKGKTPKRHPRSAGVYGVYRPLHAEDKHIFKQVIGKMVDVPLLDEGVAPGVAIQSASRARRLVRNHFLTPYLNGPERDVAKLGFNQAVAGFVKQANKHRPDVVVRPEGLCLLGHADPKREGTRIVAFTLGSMGLNELQSDDEELTAALNAREELQNPIILRDFEPCISFAKVNSINAGNALIEQLEARNVLARLHEGLGEHAGEPFATLGGIQPKLHDF